jgi:hypothetical protein
VYVMFDVVLSQQNESREPLTAPDIWPRRGTHLRRQVQGSVAHGTGGVTHPDAVQTGGARVSGDR